MFSYLNSLIFNNKIFLICKKLISMDLRYNKLNVGGDLALTNIFAIAVCVLNSCENIF